VTGNATGEPADELRTKVFGERVLRDEGEAYAAHLRTARGGPSYPRSGTTALTTFVMLNALRDTHAATSQGGEFLRAALWDE
jgi:hypothetical protein